MKEVGKICKWSHKYVFRLKILSNEWEIYSKQILIFSNIKICFEILNYTEIKNSISLNRSSFTFVYYTSSFQLIHLHIQIKVRNTYNSFYKFTILIPA